MSDKNKPHKQQLYYNIANGELPMISISESRTVQGLEVSNNTTVIKGHTINECLGALQSLINLNVLNPHTEESDS